MSATKSGGLLSICATPIGNMQDISQRVLDTLSSADIIYAEDTRVTRKLLSRYEISCEVRRCDENVTSKVAPQIVSEVESGLSIVLVSDAGMPCISDPGQRVVAAVREAGLDVTVIPGPNAALTALAGSGFECRNFYFGGFLPRKKGERYRALIALEDLDAALIFYESNHRTYDSIRAISEVFPDRRVCMARELTKLHEEYLIANSVELEQQLAPRAESLKGEVVIVVEPADKSKPKASSDDPQEASDRQAQIFARAAQIKDETDEKPSKIARKLAAEFGISKTEAYDIAMVAKCISCPKKDTCEKGQEKLKAFMD